MIPRLGQIFYTIHIACCSQRKLAPFLLSLSFSSFSSPPSTLLSSLVSFLPPLPPLPRDVPRRIAFGSCLSPFKDQTYWRRIQDLQSDLVLLLGDNVYCRDGQDDDHPEAYRTFAGNPHVRSAFSTLSIHPILDDNDYDFKNMIYIPFQDQASRNRHKERAKQYFLEFFRVHHSDPRWKTGRGVYSSLCWGDQTPHHQGLYQLHPHPRPHALQILCLDVRYHADDFVVAEDAPRHSMRGPYQSCACHDSQRTLLGPDQWTWLEAQLQQPARLRLIVSSIQVLPQGTGWDSWDLFPHERQRLLSLLSSSIHTTGSDGNHTGSGSGSGCDSGSKTLILSGDRHFGAFYRYGHHGVVFHEITSSSLTHSMPRGLLNPMESALSSGNPIHINNFRLLEIDWNSISTISDKNGPTFSTNYSSLSSPTTCVTIRSCDTGKVIGCEYNPLVV